MAINLRRLSIFGVIGIVIAGVAVPLAWMSNHTGQPLSVMRTYCVRCHNAGDLAGDISFDRLTASDLLAQPELVEAAIRKMRGRLMPPPGNAQPEQFEIDSLIAWLEDSADENAEVPVAGRVPIQRLSRSEYANAVKDLLAVEIDPAAYLPTENEVDGFSNIATALTVSPAFLEQYVNVAREVAKLAVGDYAPIPGAAYFFPPDGDQDNHIDGMPLGTRGGMKFAHRIAADGEYQITITDFDVGLYPRALETEHTAILLIDGVEVYRDSLGGPEDLEAHDLRGAAARAEIMNRFTSIPVHLKAGMHEIIVTFVERSRVATDEAIYGFMPYDGFAYVGEKRAPRVTGPIEIKGPYGQTGLSKTASRGKIFICEPEATEDARVCAEEITADLARRAFRRPVEQNDVERLMPFYEAGFRGPPGGFDAGIEQVVTAVLASPDFLYRGIAPPLAGDDATFYALSDLELATRLAFFLWGVGPDDELLELASAGALSSPEALENQALRMFADPRAETLVTSFALRWLNLDELDAVEPDRQRFPQFDSLLREDFATELDLFLRSILLEDENVIEILTAEHTYLNERLAQHYGIVSVRGPQFRRVNLEDETRQGLLGKAAVLLRTSYGDRTSPVLRGAWVMDKLLGTPPAPPPPGVETDLGTPQGEQPKTIRVRLEQHRADPSCDGCHGVIDPWGLPLENFTAIGQWRDFDVEADAPIDPSTILPDGSEITGPAQMREALTRRPDQFVQALTEKLMMYALGRELEYHDMPQIRAIVRSSEADNYRLSSIVKGIVSSDAFRMQGAAEDAEPAEAQLAMHRVGN